MTAVGMIFLGKIAGCCAGVGGGTRLLLALDRERIRVTPWSTAVSKVSK
jgi:hypothetical protein